MIKKVLLSSAFILRRQERKIKEKQERKQLWSPFSASAGDEMCLCASDVMDSSLFDC